MIVLNQPTKAIVSLVVVNSLPEDIVHDRLEELRKISDVIFLFGDIDVDPDKFTSLYQGCGYIKKKKNTTIVGLLRFAMEYCLEIFKIHKSYLICPSVEDLGKEDIDFKVLQSVGFGPLGYPIFMDRRLNNEEFKSIYVPKHGFFGEIVNSYGKYSSHVNISPIVLMKGKVIRLLLELSEGTWQTYLNSTSHWIASTFERNGIDHINENPWNEDLQTEGR